jgi:hypothetical protein
MIDVILFIAAFYALAGVLAGAYWVVDKLIDIEVEVFLALCAVTFFVSLYVFNL